MQMSFIRRIRFAGPALILLAAAVAAAPLALHRPLCGDDLQFHLVSWMDAQQSWRHGTLYPRWAPTLNFGAGESRFIFYPPLSWMLGAALGLLLPWALVPAALSFLLLAGLGMGTRWLAREALPDVAATLAGCVAMFSGYALFTSYERAAYGELCAGMWFPMLLLFALRDRNRSATLYGRALDGSTVPLALAVAGAWLSDAPAGVMAGYLLAGVALAGALLARSWFPVTRAAIAFTLGMGLSAVYVVPAAWEQRWVDILQTVGVHGDPGYRVENNFLFAHQARTQLSLHDIELRLVSFLAVSMIAVVLVSFLALYCREFRDATRESLVFQRREERIAGRQRAFKQWSIPFALISTAVLFLLFPVSLPVWEHLPKLRFLQFPWRWLVVVEAPMACLFAGAVWPARAAKGRYRTAVIAVYIVFFGVATLFGARTFLRLGPEEDQLPHIVAAAQSGTGFVGTDEFAPPGADNSTVASGLPDACLVDDFDAELGRSGDPDANPSWSADQGSCLASAQATLRQPEHLRIALSSARDGFLILRLRSHPAWRIKVNGRLMADLPSRVDGLIAVPVQRGRVDVSADWGATGDVVVGRGLSCLAFVLVLAIAWLERRAAGTPRSQTRQCTESGRRPG
jgi:hypothetical protein